MIDTPKYGHEPGQDPDEDECPRCGKHRPNGCLCHIPVNMPVKYGLSCRGCTTMVPCNPEGLAIAARHDDSDECGRMKDREAEGWNLEVLT